MEVPLLPLPVTSLLDQVLEMRHLVRSRRREASGRETITALGAGCGHG